VRICRRCRAAAGDCWSRRRWRLRWASPAAGSWRRFDALSTLRRRRARAGTAAGGLGY